MRVSFFFVACLDFGRKLRRLPVDQKKVIEQEASRCWWMKSGIIGIRTPKIERKGCKLGSGGPDIDSHRIFQSTSIKLQIRLLCICVP